MGQTSTMDTASALQAEYDALENKKSPEGYRLRQEIKDAKGGGSTQSTPPVSSGGVTPDLSRFTELRQKSAVYWLGVIPAGTKIGPGDEKASPPPSHSIDGIGGRVTFTEFHTPPEGTGQDGNARRGQYPGALVSLTENQVSQLREGLRSTLVRWRQREGRHAHGYVLRIPDAGQIDELKERMGLNAKEVARLKIRAEQFEVRDDDEPVAKFVYCQKVQGTEAIPGGPWRPSTKIPPSILSVGEIQSP